MKISKGLKQAYALQDFTFDAAMSLKEALGGREGKLKLARDDASAITALVKAWESCQSRIAFHRRVPSPGSLRPKSEKKRPRRAWSHGPLYEPVSTPASTDVPAGSPADMATAAPVETATATPPDASVPCPVCHGTRELRISGGNGKMPCGRCGGTGRQQAQSA